MGEVRQVTAELTFLDKAEGGRRYPPTPPWGEKGWYMPHVVVEGQTEYLGVRFMAGPAVEPGEVGRFGLDLMYHPQVDYSALQPGVAVSIREGGRVVATRRIVNRG